MVGPLLIPAALSVGSQVVKTALTPREEFPKISPGDLVRLAVGARDLRRRGLQPIIEEDFETGNFILSTADQRLVPQIVATLNEREFQRLTPPESSQLFDLRQQLIEFRSAGSLFPGEISSPGIVSDRVTNRSLCLASARNLAEIRACSRG